MMLYSKKKRKFYGIRRDSFLEMLVVALIGLAFGMLIGLAIITTYGGVEI